MFPARQRSRCAGFPSFMEQMLSKIGILGSESVLTALPQAVRLGALFPHSINIRQHREPNPLRIAFPEFAILGVAAAFIAPTPVR